MHASIVQIRITDFPGPGARRGYQRIRQGKLAVAHGPERRFRKASARHAAKRRAGEATRVEGACPNRKKSTAWPFKPSGRACR